MLHFSYTKILQKAIELAYHSLMFPKFLVNFISKGVQATSKPSVRR